MKNNLSTPRALVLSLAAAGVIGAVATGAYTSANAVASPSPAASAPTAAPQISMPDFSTITARHAPAVVNISVTGTTKTASAEGPQGMDPNDPMYEFFRRFQGQGQGGPRGQQPQRETPVR